jgi:hypothetical protein
MRRCSPLIYSRTGLCINMLSAARTVSDSNWQQLTAIRRSVDFNAGVWHELTIEICGLSQFVYSRRRENNASATMYMRPALFWVITQRTAVIPYRRFGTTYGFYLQGSRNPRRTFILYLIVGWLVNDVSQGTEIWGSHRAVAEDQAFWNMKAWSWVGWVVPDVSEDSNAFI